jgi:hypothetical protein
MKTLEKNQVGNKVNGSSLKGYIRCTYQDLVKALGEPTYPDPSGDDKVQKEWAVEFEGNVFTIYDWKTFDVEYTINELDEFHIGGKTYAGDFIEALEQLV